MKRTLCLFALAALTLVAVPAIAQQAGENINVLPVVSPADEPDDWYKLGDGYLQRQLEPTIGASTLNPDHLLAFFNDYRAVEIGSDIGLGESQAVAATLALARTLFALSMGPALPTIDVVPSILAAAEAWIGGSRSYDGGLTWSGFFLPGPPWDFSDVSVGTPIYGLEAATDPVLACGPCGTFYLAFVAFTRGGQSMMTVARYVDDPNILDGDSLRYDGMTVLEVGNNAEFGFFLDKPDIEVDVFRPAVTATAKAAPTPDPVDPCAHRVYVSYSTFNGQTKDGKIQSKINFARSKDYGQTFTKQKVQMPYGQGQGSAIAVDPLKGTIYLFWRHFFDPHAILMTKSTDFGVRWSKVANLTEDVPMAPFDQPTLATNTPGVDPSLGIAFRSNGFPTATVAVSEQPEGVTAKDASQKVATVYAAWQERVNLTTGFPDPDGSPRIVMMRSQDDGVTWTGFDSGGNGYDINGDPITRQAVDFGGRYEPFDPWLTVPPPPPSATPTPTTTSTLEPSPYYRFSGPQVMPKISFVPGRLMVAYYESRGLIVRNEYEETVQPAGLFGVPGYITGYPRVLDFRAAVLDPGNGEFVSTTQISRYPMSADADLEDGIQNLGDVALVYTPCTWGGPEDPELSEAMPPCARQVNRANSPTSAAGTSPFIGDYVDLIPFVQFVPSPEGWRWAIEAADLPSRGFRAVFTDNRHLLPPWDDPTVDEVRRYPNYGPPGIGGACTNAGSRNTDVLTSRIEAELVVSAPTTYKLLLNEARSFPISVSNRTDEFRYYRLSIADPGAAVASFSLRGDFDQGNVEIFPFSSVAQVIYVEPDVDIPIRVDVTEIDADGGIIEGGQTGSVTFNADPNIAAQQPPLPPEKFKPQIGDAFVINYDFEDAFVINSGGENAFVINGATDNAFVINAFVINAFVINSSLASPEEDKQKIYGITDTTWTVTPGTDTTSASSYLPLINIDNAEQFLGDYAFQLIVEKPAAYGSADACAAAYNNVSQQQIVSNVIQDPNAFVINPTPENAFVINPTPENAFVINAFPENAFVINSTFAMAPSDSAYATAKVNETDDSATKADPPSNEVRMTLRAFQLTEFPDFVYNPDPNTPGGAPPSAVVMQLACDPAVDDCVATNAPDLIPSCNVPDECPSPPETPSPAPYRVPVNACGNVSFPAGGWTLVNVGNKFARSRGVEVNEVMRHGIYLSKDDDLEDPVVELPLDPGETIDFNSDDVQLATVESQYDPLPPDWQTLPEPKTLTVMVTDETLYLGFQSAEDPLGELGFGDGVLVQGVEDGGVIVAEVVNIDNTDPVTPGVLEVRGTFWGLLEGGFELRPDGTETFPAFTFALPPGVPHEDFNLILFGDYPRLVSEFNEPNNTIVVPISVESTTAFYGLQPPTDFSTYFANFGSVVPLIWQYLDPDDQLLDTQWAESSIRFGIRGPYDCQLEEPSSEAEVIEDPGSSDLRYDAGTWQYNWQTKDLVLLPDPNVDTCYSLRIYSDVSCEGQNEGDGPFIVQSK